MLNDFINALRTECPWYSAIFEKYPIIMLYMTGSQLYGNTDERSDYDMNAICDVETIEKNEPGIVFTWKGKKVHWSWLPLSLYTTFPKTATPLQNVGLSQFYYIRNEVIVYRNPEYESLINNLIDKKDEIALQGSLNFIDQMHNYMNEICEAGEIDEKHYSKFLSHLCRVYYVLSKEEENIGFMKAIKRIRWQPVSDDYKNKAVQCLQKLKEIIKDKKLL